MTFGKAARQCYRIFTNHLCSIYAGALIKSDCFFPNKIDTMLSLTQRNSALKLAHTDINDNAS